MLMRRFVFAPLAALLLTGLATLASDAQESVAPAQPTASALLDQGWTADDRERWYGATQGSRLVPLAWLRALEQPLNGAPFLDAAHMEALRYLPRANDQLPVGFAIDRRADTRMGATRLRWRVGQRNDEPWVGFTCAACHTGQMTYQGATLRIEGGATLADFQGFIEGFNYALTQTRDDPARFERFAVRVVGPADARDARRNRTMLRGALSDLVDYQNGIAAMNETSLRYGHGRLDAVGYILNKVSFVATRNAPTANEPDAPVSYPFLWNVPQHRFVQWNGVAENEPRSGPQVFDHGALGRNTGEVIGVFADVRPRGFMQIGARSSADVANLVALEQQLMRLRPPRWPAEIFGAPDRALVAEGRTLFGEHCVACHTPLARTDLTTRNIEIMVPFTIEDFDDTPGTDPWMACNTATNEAVTGALRGERRELIGGGALGRVEPASEMLRVLVTQALLFQTSDVGASAVMSAWGSHPRPRIEASGGFEGAGGGARGGVAASRPGQYTREERRARCIAALQVPNAARILAYKARPLTGAWATAPYLHNGSVANLYELLLPPAERSTRFNVGSREFDPVRVGYVTEARADNPFVFNARDEAGALIEGNANLGHDYNNSALTPAQRWAIVEYLKVIGED